MTNTGDERVLIEAARREPAAFGVLYDAYYERILSYLFKRTLDMSAAEDITADTFTKAMRKLSKCGKDTPFAAWLYRIATNELRMHWRFQWRHSRVEDARRWEMAYGHVTFRESDGTSAEELQARLTRMEAVRAAVERLPERYRAPLVLRYYEGLSYEEIGAVLERPAATVKVHVHRGLMRLKKTFSEINETYSG